MGFSLWWQQLALVMAGGALGAGGRYWIGGLLLRRIGEGLPWGTLAVNLFGSFAIGFLAEWLEGRGPAGLYWRAFLIIGLLGGLTTYSALMLEVLLMARTERTLALFGYLTMTLVLGVMLVWLGVRVGIMMRPDGGL